MFRHCFAAIAFICVSFPITLAEGPVVKEDSTKVTVNFSRSLTKILFDEPSGFKGDIISSLLDENESSGTRNLKSGRAISFPIECREDDGVHRMLRVIFYNLMNGSLDRDVAYYYGKLDQCQVQNDNGDVYCDVAGTRDDEEECRADQTKNWVVMKFVFNDFVHGKTLTVDNHAACISKSCNPKKLTKFLSSDLFAASVMKKRAKSR